MIFDEQLFTRNIISIQDIFAWHVGNISFSNLGLKRNKIVDVLEYWGSYFEKRKKDNWSLLDVKEYDILMQFNSTANLLRDVFSRKVYEYV